MATTKEQIIEKQGKIQGKILIMEMKRVINLGKKAIKKMKENKKQKK